MSFAQLCSIRAVEHCLSFLVSFGLAVNLLGAHVWLETLGGLELLEFLQTSLL